MELADAPELDRPTVRGHRMDGRDATRMVDAVAGHGRLVPEVARAQAQDEPFEDALERSDVDAAVSAADAQGLIRPGQEDAQDLGLRRCAVLPAMQGPDLEDADVRPPLALVLDEDPEVPGQERAPKLGVVQGDRVDGTDDGGVVRARARGARGPPGPTRPCVTTSSRPIPDMSVADLVAEAPRLGPQGGISVSGSRPRIVS